MRIHNLYEDADGESHFRDIAVDWAEETPSVGKGTIHQRQRSALSPRSLFYAMTLREYETPV